MTATVLHEMVHLYNIQTGVQDTSRGGTYHNKRFREAAEARDLHISYDKRIGWSVTEPTEALIEFIISQGWDDIMMNRKDGFSMRGVGGPGAKGGTVPPTGRDLQHPQAGLSQMRAERPGHESGEYLLRGLPLADDGGLRNKKKKPPSKIASGDF